VVDARGDTTESTSSRRLGDSRTRLIQRARPVTAIAAMEIRVTLSPTVVTELESAYPSSVKSAAQASDEAAATRRLTHDDEARRGSAARLSLVLLGGG
jgi:hypothetical protein